MKKSVLVVLIIIFIIIGITAFFLIKNYDNLTYSFYKKHLKKYIIINCIPIDVEGLSNHNSELSIDLNKLKAYYIVFDIYPEYDTLSGIDAKPYYIIRQKKKIDLSQDFVDKIIQFLDDSNNIEEDIYINDEYVGEETIRLRTKKKCYNVTYKNENKYYKFEKLNLIINEILEEK